jgi:hypothetical protein
MNGVPFPVIGAMRRFREGAPGERPAAPVRAQRVAAAAQLVKDPIPAASGHTFTLPIDT